MATMNNCVELMLRIVNRHEGVLVRTIGDEIMCRFPHPDSAVEAACEINGAIRIPFGAATIFLKVRTGLHNGDIIIDETDIYGDAVNVAARMASIAKAQQIITYPGYV